MSDDGEKTWQIIGLVECVISATYWFHTNVVGKCRYVLRWMAWYVCPESDMARLSGAYSMVSCPRVSLFRPPALIHARGRIFAPQAPKRVETAWEGPCGAQEASRPGKIWFRRTGREKWSIKSQSDLLGGDARSRRVRPRTVRPRVSKDRRPGSTDCPGTVL